jgi:hypothetical protein
MRLSKTVCEMADLVLGTTGLTVMVGAPAGARPTCLPPDADGPA